MDPQDVDLASHPFVGLVLQVRDANKFPHAFGFESPDPFFIVRKQGPCFTAVEGDGGDKKLLSLNLLAKLMVLHRQILFSLAIASIAEAILMQYYAEQA